MPVSRISAALGLACAAAAGPALAQNADESLTIHDGAKVFVCEQVGFLSILQDTQDALYAPQLPSVDVQYASGLFVLAEPEAEFDGVRVSFTSFLRHQDQDRWQFTGFQGTEPFVDSCRDITSELAFAFPKIAVAATWGLPQVSERVALFDAMEDDLRTRLEQNTADLEQALAESEALRAENAELTLAVAELRDAADAPAVVIAKAAPQDAEPAATGVVETAAGDLDGVEDVKFLRSDTPDEE